MTYNVKEMYLCHRSTYDEMIGHDVNTYGNEMLVPIGDYFADSKQPVH